MGRWGDKLYESDVALDYFGRITDSLFQEASFRLAPEQVLPNAQWILNVITAIEMMLVLDKNDVGFLSCFMDQEEAVKRWQETFFSVWDAEWDDLNDTHLPFHSYTYRQTHRTVAVKWFDRLDELARFWDSDDMQPGQLSKFKPDKGLPYFSALYSGFMLGDLIQRLTHSIIFEFYDEKRELAIGFYETEKVWVGVDVIALFCESYSYRPTFTLQAVENWQKKLIDIWKSEFSDEAWERRYEYEMYQNMIASFDKLKAVTKKYEDEH